MVHYQYILRSLTVHLVAKTIEGGKDLMLLGKFNFLAGTDFVYVIIICMRSLFYHNIAEIIVKKDSTIDKCQQGFRVCNFHFKYQQLHTEIKQNPKQVMNYPSVKKFMNSVQTKQSALEG